MKAPLTAAIISCRSHMTLQTVWSSALATCLQLGVSIVYCAAKCSFQNNVACMPPKKYDDNCVAWDTKGRVQHRALQAGQSFAGNGMTWAVVGCRNSGHKHTRCLRAKAASCSSGHGWLPLIPAGPVRPGCAAFIAEQAAAWRTHCASSSINMSDPNVFSPLYLMYRNPSLSFISS